MTDTLPKLRLRPDRPVEPRLLDILRQVDVAAHEHGIDYFVGGALARDLILLHVFGKDTGRATRDVDLGICIDDWAQLDTLKTSLTQGGSFAMQPKIAHRLIYRQTGDHFGIPLDLLPFGGVEQADGTIAWPPGMEIVMNVAGFAEARASAFMVEVTSGLAVPVTSLPSLAVLKLIAWRDRHMETPKDATDFLLIARHYADAGNFDRLYEMESDLLQAADFDPELAGTMLLGKDAMAISSAATAQTIADMLSEPRTRQRLNDQLLQSTLSAGDNVGSARVSAYLEAFHRGWRGRR